MNQEVIVIMESEVYGHEEFRYDSVEEANAGIERLEAKAKELNDGVERNIFVAN